MKYINKKLIVAMSLFVLLISTSGFASTTALVARGEHEGEMQHRRPEQQQELNRAQGYEHGYQQGKTNNNNNSGNQNPTVVVPEPNPFPPQ